MVSSKVRYWVGGVSIAAILLALWAFWPLFVPARYPCNLPSLESTIPSTTISEIGGGGYYQHVCPTPLAQEILLERRYGVIRLQLWGSPHRLYMLGTSTDGRPLGIRGPRVEAFETNVPDSFLAEYTHRVTFDGQNSASLWVPQNPEMVSINVYDGDKRLEEIELRYVPTRCDCVAPL